jgi:D-alanyl-D-alanine carboxypeptidase
MIVAGVMPLTRRNTSWRRAVVGVTMTSSAQSGSARSYAALGDRVVVFNRWLTAAVALQFAVVAVFVSGCGSSNSTTHVAASRSATSAPRVVVWLPTKPMTKTDAAVLEQQIEPVVKSVLKLAPEVYIGVWDPRTGVFMHAYGHAVRGGTRATVADHVRIGSITKTFTATVILQLVAQGHLSLGGTVARYDPTLAKQFPPLGALTVRQLLSMRSGLPDYADGPGGVFKQIVQNPHRVWSAQQLIAGALKRKIKPAGTPGYSNTNYIALQQIAEQVTGQPLAKLIADHVTGPLGIHHTILPPNQNTTLPAPASDGYINRLGVLGLAQDGAKVPVWTDTASWNASYAQGAGDMTSTIGDLGVWAASMFGDALLPDRLAAARLQTTTPIAPGVTYGLGILNYGQWYGHEGQVLGWEGDAWHDPQTGVTFVAFANSSAGASGSFERLLSEL